MYVRLIRKITHDCRGATIIEYGLILALIFVVMMIGLRTMAGQGVGTLNYVKNQVLNAGA